MAASRDTTRAVVTVTGGLVTVTGVAVGNTMVTVTARDPEGLSTEQAFAVRLPNRAPEPRGTIANRDVHVGDTVALDIAANFTDPDGDALLYAAISSDPSRATVAVSGSVVTVTGVAGGNTTVTVTVRDSAGLSARQEFSVRVPNQAPEAVGTIADRAVEINQSISLDVSPYFGDPDGDDLMHSATSSSTARVTVSASGSTVTIKGERVGTATITVTATDTGGLSATQRFDVTVNAAAQSDLVVLSPVAHPDVLGPGESFALSAVVHNQGTGGASSGTTLRYYRSLQGRGRSLPQPGAGRGSRPRGPYRHSRGALPGISPGHLNGSRRR